MAVRRESVLLEVDDRFTRDILKAAAATKVLDQALNSLSRSAVTSSRDITRAQQDTERMRRSAEQTGPAIDRLSGRLAIMAKAALVLGPALIPIGAVGVAGVAGLASQLGFAAVGMGSLLVATRGLGDALKAVNDAALEPTAANLEKARVAMAGLGPEARQFVLRFQELRPVLGDIRDAAAAGWFPGLTTALDDIERVAPRVASIFESIGTAGGNLVAQGAAALAGPEWDEFLRFVEAEGPEALETFGRSVGNLVHGLAELWMAFTPLNNDFSSWLLSASRDFDAWAAGLSQTEGFQDFIEYVRESGPQVGRTLGSIAEATLAIVKAAAPLGGPVLEAFEAIADLVTLIAESPVGPKIVTMAAAFVVLNKTLAVTAGLMAKIGFAGAAGAIRGAGPGGGGGTGGGPAPIVAGGPRAALGTIKAMRADMAALNKATSAQIRASQQLSAAQARVNAQMAQYRSAALKAGAGTAAFAVATGAVGQEMGLQNTAMLGLVGSMINPYGAAIGATIGLYADLKGAIEETNEVIASGDRAMVQSEFAKRMDNWKPGASWLTGGFNKQNLEDVLSLLETGETVTERLEKESAKFGKLGGSLKLDGTSSEDIDRARQDITDTTRRAEAAELGLSAATSDLAASLGLTNAETLRAITLIDQRTAAANEAFGAETQWREALKAATEQAKSNNAGIRGNSEAALNNRSALEGLASAWARQREAMEAAGRSSGAIEGKYRIARRAFIETATSMGVPIERARELARTLLAIPESRAVKVTANTGDSMVQLNRIKAAIDAIRDKKVTITTIRQEQGLARRADAMDARGSADGSTVPKDGGPYADRYPYLLAPGEEVISNRYGQADRHRPLLKAINAGRLADGGTAGRVAALDFAGLPAVNLTTASLKELTKALRLSTKALDKERSQREDVLSKMTDLRSSVRGRLTSELFGQTDAWTDGGGVADVLATLNGDIASGKALQAQIAQLRKKGLDGGALADLLANADAATIANFAGASAADLRKFETAYEKRASLASSVGSSASSAAFGAELKVANRQLAAIERREARIERAIREEHRTDRRSTKRGAGSGARNRKRG